MKTADEWFEAYGESHQHPVNKRIHWICVPLIMFSVVGLLWQIHLAPFVNGGALLMTVAVVYYWVISRPLAVGMLVVCALISLSVFALASATQFALWQLSLIIFVFAWIFQFVGHKLEGKRPSFLQDLQFLLIGPLWLLGHIYRALGIKY